MHRSDTLVIKLCSDSFERYINDGLSEECDILDIGTFYEAGCNPLKRNISIARRTLAFNKEGLFLGYKKIIVFDHIEIFFALLLIFASKKQTRVYLWLWNILTPRRAKKIRLIKHLGSVYTFDEAEALKYSINWNSQFYYISDDKTSFQMQYDLFFVGRDKGRKACLNQIEEILRENNERPCLNVIDNNNFWEYSQIISLIKSSKALLDLSQSGQVGLTIRAMEALFYDRKLVTNNQSIKKTGLYSRENVFILSENNITDLPKFLVQDCVKYDSKTRDFYSISAWLKRFMYKVNDEHGK